MLTTFDDDEYVIKAMTYGAAGYLLKDIDSGKLIQAVRDGVSGSIILPGRIAAKITSRLTGTFVTAAYDFSDRETEIIRLLIAGKSNAEIAEVLYLSVGTVKNYISQIYLKLDVSDRANAVIALKNAGF
jgi:DNA-binding NarL/FixJ family response regulator